MASLEKELWIFGEEDGGELLDVSLELLGKGRELADKGGMTLAAVLIGPKVRSLCRHLFDHGADKVYVCEDPIFRDAYLFPEGNVLCQIIRRYKPQIILFGATSFGIQLAPTVAALVDTGLSAHCVDLDIDKEGMLHQMVPGFGGNIMATILCPSHRPQMATIQPGVFPKAVEKSGKGEIVEIAPEIEVLPEWPKIVEIHKEESREAPLKGAETVIAGGWGIGDQEGWKLLEDLASILGAAVGATRPATDEGWAEHEQMIGQSGVTIRPKFYIGAGISGAMHHMVGINEAGVILAINNDPKAPIFEMCDVAVQGDFKRIIPCLIEKIEERRQRQK